MAIGGPRTTRPLRRTLAALTPRGIGHAEGYERDASQRDQSRQAPAAQGYVAANNQAQSEQTHSGMHHKSRHLLAAVEQVNRARFQQHFVEEVVIVDLPPGHINIGRNGAPHVR